MQVELHPKREFGCQGIVAKFLFVSILRWFIFVSGPLVNTLIKIFSNTVHSN